MNNLDTIDTDTNVKTMIYAGFWKRFAAYIIDSIILAFATNAIKWEIFRSLGSDVYSSNGIAPYVWQILFLIFSWCYFAGMESSPLKATIGKLAVGIFVSDLNGERVSFGKASGRFFGKLISGLLIGIGFIIAGTSTKKQALHDSMSDCLVLSK